MWDMPGFKAKHKACFGKSFEQCKDIANATEKAQCEQATLNQCVEKLIAEYQPRMESGGAFGKLLDNPIVLGGLAVGAALLLSKMMEKKPAARPNRRRRRR
jgi:hypothetical protein